MIAVSPVLLAKDADITVARLDERVLEKASRGLTYVISG